MARSNYEISFSVTIAEEGAAEGSVRSDLDNRKMFVDGGVRDQTYVDGRTTYEKDQSELWTEESDRSFEELHDPTRINFFDRMLPMMLEQGSYSPAETVRRGGRDLRRLTVVDAITTDERLAVTDSSGEAFVSGDGVVFGVRLSREIESENGATTADYSFSIDALGDVSVDRPGWADRAEGNDG